MRVVRHEYISEKKYYACQFFSRMFENRFFPCQTAELTIYNYITTM